MIILFVFSFAADAVFLTGGGKALLERIGEINL